MAKKTTKKQTRRAPRRPPRGAARAADPAESTQPQTISAVRSFRLRRGQPRSLNLLMSATKFFRKRKIHPRRIIPKVPSGEFRNDPQPTAALSLSAPPAMEIALHGERAGAAPMAASDNLVF